MAIKVDKQSVRNTIHKMRGKAKAYGKTPTRSVVGYQMPYAIYVHEDLTANHPNGGQAKYLEAPARKYSKDMSLMIRRALRKGTTLQSALLQAAYFLLKQSQPLVPVDTGALVNSGFVLTE